jgi:Asp-tRNA(Asn)/Glu-tRNA(Gln) amidotransferase A subunit family amidase
MGLSDDLAFMPARTLRELIGQRRLSPLELTELTLRQIERLNPQLNALLTVSAEPALDAARKAEAAVMRGDTLRPLHGIPISIKDLEEVAGVRFTRGSWLHRNDIGERDALAVERLRAAGAIIVGTTNTPEFGAAGTTENRLGPPCRNPWNPERTSGGSSGGAAASVAAGFTAVALGSDGGGSIRIPASFCGLYGIKATQGRVPRRHAGLHSWHPINNSSVGPLSRDVRDSAILLGVLAGPSADAENGTIAAPPPDVATAIGRGKPDAPEAVLETFAIFAATKTYSTHRDALDQAGHLTDYFREALERGRATTAEQLFTAESRIAAYRAYMREFFTHHDVLLSPTLAVAAFPIGDVPRTIGGRPVTVPRLGYFPFTYPFNLLGNPAASVPCGFTGEALPVGLQIVGRLEDEATVIAASAAFEAARPWAARRPPVS